MTSPTPRLLPHRKIRYCVQLSMVMLFTNIDPDESDVTSLTGLCSKLCDDHSYVMRR